MDDYTLFSRRRLVPYGQSYAPDSSSRFEQGAMRVKQMERAQERAIAAAKQLLQAGAADMQSDWRKRLYRVVPAHSQPDHPEYREYGPWEKRPDVNARAVLSIDDPGLYVRAALARDPVRPDPGIDEEYGPFVKEKPVDTAVPLTIRPSYQPVIDEEYGPFVKQKSTQESTQKSTLRAGNLYKPVTPPSRGPSASEISTNLPLQLGGGPADPVEPLFVSRKIWRDPARPTFASSPELPLFGYMANRYAKPSESTSTPPTAALSDPVTRALAAAKGLQRQVYKAVTSPAATARAVANAVLSGEAAQSTGQPVVENGVINWGDPDNPADFFRADQALQELHPYVEQDTVPEPVEEGYSDGGIVSGLVDEAMDFMNPGFADGGPVEDDYGYDYEEPLYVEEDFVPEDEDTIEYVEPVIVDDLEGFAEGGPVLLQDEYPTEYMPEVGRQVMAGGGPAEDGGYAEDMFDVDMTPEQARARTAASIQPREGEEVKADGEGWQRALQNYRNFPVRPGEATMRPRDDWRANAAAFVAGEGGTSYGSELRRRAGEALFGPTYGVGLTDVLALPTVLDAAQAYRKGNTGEAAINAATLGIPFAAAARKPIANAVRAARDVIASPAGRTAAAGATGAAVMSPDDAEAANVLKFIRSLTPMGHYSPGAEAAAALSQAKGSPDQLIAALRNAGVKPVELDQVAAKFAGQPSVTRDELADYLNKSLPKIEETVLGGKLPTSEYKIVNEGNGYNVLTPSGDRLHTKPVSLPTAENSIRIWGVAKGDAAKILPTKYEDETLVLPGGKSYREVLLREPSSWKPEIKEKYGKFGFTDPNGKYREYWSKDDAERASRSFYRESGKFTSSHWDQPNVLAHMRLADRTGPNGEKILHLEELQSDWAQMGRKLGFKDTSKNWKEEYDNYRKDAVDRWVEMKVKEVMKSDPELFENADLVRKTARTVAEKQGMIYVAKGLGEASKHADLYAKMDQYRSAIPKGPYVTNTAAWTDLGLKRALKEAADGGYDKMVWTPGIEQSKRYDLSTKIDELKYMRNSDGTFNIYAIKDGEEVATKLKLTPDELADNVGKGVAAKMAETPEPDKPGFIFYNLTSGNRSERYPTKEAAEAAMREFKEKYPNVKGSHAVSAVPGKQSPMQSLSGENLSLASRQSKGMENFYDKIVPQQLQKILKKLDPSVKIGREVVNGVEVPVIPITPKLREAIKGGLPAYANGGVVEDRKGYAGGRAVTKALKAAEELFKGSDVIKKDAKAAAEKMSERTPSGDVDFGQALKDYEYSGRKKGDLQPWKEFNPEQAYKEDAILAAILTDRSAAGRIVDAINGVKLSTPVDLRGGGEFQRSLEGPEVWASRPPAVKNMQTRIRKGLEGLKADPENPLFASTVLMSKPAIDSTQMMAKAMLRQIDATRGKIDPAAAETLDAFIRKSYPDWPGVLSPVDAERFLAEKEVGARTSSILQAFDKAGTQRGGLPNLGSARFAMMEPRLITADQGASGFAVSRLDPKGATSKAAHDTYPTGMLGPTQSSADYLGGTKYQVPLEVMFPDWYKTVKPTYLDKRSGLTMKTSPTMIQQSVLTQVPLQRANQEWLDNIMKYYEGDPKPWGYAHGGPVEERDGYAGKGAVVSKVVQAALDAIKGGRKVFPKPERMWPEGSRPIAGDYIDPATGEVLTGMKPSRAVIGVGPDGKPIFMVDPNEVPVSGSPGKGSTKTKTNLFKKKAGWEWSEAPKGYEDVSTLVSVENRGKHYYGIGADFPRGVDLEKYPTATSEPRLRPTTQGNVYPGNEVGRISVRGKEHPVYDMLTIRNLIAGAPVGIGAGAALSTNENPNEIGSPLPEPTLD